MTFQCKVTDAPKYTHADAEFVVAVKVDDAPKATVNIVLKEGDHVLDQKRARANASGVARARCKARLKGGEPQTIRLATLIVTAKSGGKEATPDAHSIQVQS